ncbi:3-oxoacyl-ACP reductase [Granulicatella sp. zg-ZJ]|uniref:3-oxoacyl-ACP reductase n=1 Tax=unclassified Granulicatella TaxID=2630493 RepID=UPI0013C1DB96|nr:MULTISPECIES: 3-oxoacyl-ACP reductase [unclassified Granulicatella]MBS4750224.1 3-oxoacyl-ACP reductase [Carnobacteriaceae bacterium zg-ZUI78]NEW63338.1 3-oxoacyl-ACP reductase [Granulicatella sp. zg-ZJ]NEW65680.1 3-oxoacyl-ACP reductase [Granulicatella sp. zg-84]QMI85679.1 3-oxoacyl-ACP reductase [Carnobacteriaceae bacterium zg-84]
MFINYNVLVTGSSSGIGKAQAEAFLEQNAIVYGFDKQKSQITHPNYHHIIGDVCLREDIAKLPKSIDILINSAGILDNYMPSLETSEDLWDCIMTTNVKSMFLITNHVLNNMLKKQQGIIINMASIAGFLAGGGGAAYTASKHAVIGYTKQLAYDYASKGIRVNGIAPGAIKTSMTQADFEGTGDTAKWVAEQTPAKRWAFPNEIADATIFLASSSAAYLHGHILTIDGGWSIK